jgi:rubrerythrin
MLYVKRQKLDNIDDLRIALANAIKLEFATVPPYLTALYSIKDGTNAAIAANIRLIVIQEMLHLSLAANILNAVDGKPDFPGSVPKYPGPLPMGIGSEPGKPFIVPLKKLSHDTVRNIFMVIEEPETPIVFPEKKMKAAAAPEYHTIGEFYEAVSKLIGDLGESIFTGDKSRQVTGWFGPDLLFPIDSVATAQKAIQIIVTQGEGTPTDPSGGPTGLAHYYRFEEIARGQTLSLDLTVPPYYSWGPPPIVLDEQGVWPVVDNPPDVHLPDDSAVATASRTCDRTFSALVDALQLTFDGSPDHLDASIGLMYSLRLQAQGLMATPIPNLGANAGPRFLYAAATASG